MRNTIQTLVAEEMYYGLILPRAKQCKTIHDELTIICLSKNDRMNTEITQDTKRVYCREKCPIVFLKSLFVKVKSP